jgi:hypothetical protein
MSSFINRLTPTAQQVNLARRWTVQNENDLLQVSRTMSRSVGRKIHHGEISELANPLHMSRILLTVLYLHFQ